MGARRPTAGEQITTSGELRKARSEVVFPAEEVSNSIQEGSGGKEVKLPRARSKVVTLGGGC